MLRSHVRGLTNAGRFSRLRVDFIWHCVIKFLGQCMGEDEQAVGSEASIQLNRFFSDLGIAETTIDVVDEVTSPGKRDS